MGSQFSVGPFIRDCKILINMSLVKIQTLIIRFERTLNPDFDDNMFMDRKQFQWTFELSDISTYKIFSRFDENSRGYVPALDVWGALVLASSAPSPDKINFLFSMMDRNRDQHLSYVDAEMLIRAVTRGFSKLKGLPCVPVHTIHTVLEAIYGRDIIQLNEDGEIHLRDLRSLLTVDDLPRTYFSNLGTLLVVQDSSKLIDQRSDLLKELAVVNAEFEEISRRIDNKVDDETMFLKERGGDAKLVRLTDKVLVNSHHKGVANEIKIEDEKNQKKNSLVNRKNIIGEEEQQRLRRQKRSERLANQDGDSDGAEEWDKKGVFSRGCRPEASAGAGGSEGSMREAMQFKWSTLKPQSSDGLVKLDLDLLLDVLEAAGITISDEHALQCLRETPKNQLGRHNLNDIIVWIRRYQVNPPPINPPFWRDLAVETYRKYFLEKKDKAVDIFKGILNQHSIIEEIKRLHQQKASIATKINPKVISKRFTTSVQFSQASIKGSRRLTTWQKHRHTDPPCTVALLATFGPYEKKKLTEAEKQKQKNFTSKKKVEEKPEWKTNIKLEIATKPETKRHSELLGPDGILKDLDSVEPVDLLEYFDSFGYKVELTPGEIAAAAAAAAAKAAGIQVKTEDPSKNLKSGSILWIHIPVKETASAEEAYCLLKTSTNFFESIPLDNRHDIYTTVKSQLFYLEGKPDDEANEIGAMNKSPSQKSVLSSPSKQKVILKHPRLICIGLLHERDPLEWVEDQIMSPELTFTRSLRKLMIEFNFLESFTELYEKNCEMEEFPDKLFGPQEDELGEEGMNPLRFAKICRKRQKAAQDAIENVGKMSTEELREHLKERGYNNSGTRSELMTLAKVAFAKQAELIGFGELSNFGASIVQDIFKMFDQDKDGALSLFEFNKFLVATGSQALYDTKQYKAFLSSEQYHVDSHQRLTPEGLMAYYERYGRLARDVNLLGIRSFSTYASGQVEARLEYEPDAVGSLCKLMESNSLAQMYLKKTLGGISSISDILLTAKFDHFYEIFKLLRLNNLPFFKDLYTGTFSPGWISASIHSIVEFVADGNEGVIPALRRHCKEKLSGFYHYTKAFNDLCSGDVQDTESSFNQGGDQESETVTSISTLSFENLTAGGYESTVDESSVSVEKDRFGKKTPPPMKITAEEDLKDEKKRRTVLEMMRVFYKPVPSVDLNADDDPESERKISENDGRPPLTPEIEMWENRLNRLLPRLTGYSHKKTKTVDEINTLLLAASEIFKRLGSGERLTRTESDRLQVMKQRYETRAANLAAQLENSVNLAASHFLSFYDAFCLYGEGISQIGYGGNHFGMKLQTNGIDWIQFLPPGMGEPAVRSRLKQEKYERAKQRKNAAVSAIERERLRRELDEEDREARRKYEIANAQLIRDDEEKTMFGEVYSGLVTAREEPMSTKNANILIEQWEKLLDMRERRYPDSLKLAVISNDVGCVKIELFPVSDLRLGQAVVCLRNAALIVYDQFSKALNFVGEIVTNVEEAEMRIFNMLPPAEKNLFNTSMDNYDKIKRENMSLMKELPPRPTHYLESLRSRIAPQNPAAYLLIFLNYFSILRRTNSTHELNDVEQQRMKEVVYFIHSTMLNEKERKNVGVERRMELFTVFPLGNVAESLKQTLQELADHRAAYKKTVDSAALQKRLEEYKGRGGDRDKAHHTRIAGDEKDMKLIAMEALNLVDPKQAKKILFKRQMKEARKKRKIAIKQRRKMYEMIASDKISEFFHKQAQKADPNIVKWGDEEEKVHEEDPFYVSEESSSDDSTTINLPSEQDSSKLTREDDEEEDDDDDENNNSSISSPISKDKPVGSLDTGSFKNGRSLDSSSIISDLSEQTSAPGGKKEPTKKSVMSFLLKGRK